MSNRKKEQSGRKGQIRCVFQVEKAALGFALLVLPCASLRKQAVGTSGAKWRRLTAQTTAIPLPALRRVT
jgi:hypothetical protein